MATSPDTTVEPTKTGTPHGVDWNALLARYRGPVTWKSVFQLVTTGALFVAGWMLMHWSLQVGYWLTLLLALPTALCLVRLFMLQHDCGHGAFFRSQKLADLVGTAIGVLTLVPYGYWRKTHAIHHATSGNLDVRGFGDIDTLTAKEYLSLPRHKRLLYRLYRHPVTMLVVGPFYQFVLKHRLPLDIPKDWKREWRSVHVTNLLLAGLITVMCLVVGVGHFVAVQLPVTLLSGSIGVYLFYVQHQYEDTYWRYREQWNYFHSALEGASYLEMPRVLQWFTANIGLHHIHHLSARIPNYHLERAYRENPELHKVTRLRLLESVKTLRLTLWDEDDRRLIGFRELRDIRRRYAAARSRIEPTRPEALPPTWR